MGIFKLLPLFILHKLLYQVLTVKTQKSQLTLLLYWHRAELKPGARNPHFGRFRASLISVEPRLRPPLTPALFQRQTELPEAFLRASPDRWAGATPLQHWQTIPAEPAETAGAPGP